MLPAYDIDITDDYHRLAFDADRLREAVTAVLSEAGIRAAAISVAVVDDAAIHALNVEFLSHDEATDVITFPLAQGEDGLEGEIVTSGEYASAMAGKYGWPADDELLLYVVHGALHLVGYDDQDEASQRAMRKREDEVLAPFGLRVPRDDRAT